ncbi:MAG: protein phosphatase 2C domain-containing protein [Thermoanaerobaculia bacterium]|nr:protein phosphatase 2C domain-containing protein [Thermoanaerobaculia bacterium]
MTRGGSRQCGEDASGTIPRSGLTVAGRTDQGRVRSQNEDQYLVARLGSEVEILESSLAPSDRRGEPPPACGWLLIVADGMGGHSRGREASSLALETVMESLVDSMPALAGPCSEEEIGRARTAVEGAIRRSASRVDVASREDGDFRPMGTTLTSGLLIGDRLFVVHAGDSRLYRLRDGDLEQLSRDHTLAQALVDQGALDEEEIRDSPFRHQLVNTVGGGSDEVEPETRVERLSAEDRLLLCTDGLTSEVEDDRIAEILGSGRDPAETCDLLVAEAKRNGGRDNITVVVARWNPAHRGSDHGSSERNR